MDAARRAMLYARLVSEYPDAASELDFRSDYELVVAVVLSAQCTDKKVNEVTPGLFRKYPDFPSLAAAPEEELEAVIRQVNYYRTKAKHLRLLAARVVAAYGGVLPDTHEELLTLPGVGRKTANVVTSERGVGDALAVDTHVYRVARRLGLSRGATPLKVELDLTEGFAAADWRGVHHRLILHGRRVCRARAPLCEGCVLADVCPSAPRVRRV